MTKPHSDALAEKMERIAEQIADRLIDGSPPSKGIMEVFKVLTGYFAATRRLGKGAVGTEEPEFSFAKARSDLALASKAPKKKEELK